MQPIANKVMKTNVNTGEEFYVISAGQCQPKEGNAMHPKVKKSKSKKYW
jgi:protein-tyrosine-phosphatase